MKIRIIIILIGVSVVSLGLMGPTAFIDSQGKLNLFEISKVAQQFKLPNSQIYSGIGWSFVTVSGLVLLFLAFRWLTFIKWSAIVGLLIWAISVGFFYWWHSTEFEKIKHIKPDAQPADLAVYAAFIKSMALQWGVYLIAIGFAIIFIAAMLFQKRKK